MTAGVKRTDDFQIAKHKNTFWALKADIDTRNAVKSKRRFS